MSILDNLERCMQIEQETDFAQDARIKQAAYAKKRRDHRERLGLPHHGSR